MKNIFSKKNFIIAAAICLFVILPFLAVQAADRGLLPSETGGKCPTGAVNCGNYTLNDGVQLIVNVMQWILGIVGSLTLLMFVVGGFMFLISGGNAQTVEKGKKILIGSVVGLAIVFGSYMIVKFSMTALGLNWSGTISRPSVTGAGDICSQKYGDKGYSCMDKSLGDSCITGLCLGDNADNPNIKCCKAKTCEGAGQGYACMAASAGRDCKTDRPCPAGSDPANPLVCCLPQ